MERGGINWIFGTKRFRSENRTEDVGLEDDEVVDEHDITMIRMDRLF